MNRIVLVALFAIALPLVYPATSAAVDIVWSGSGTLGADPYGTPWNFYNAPAHILPVGRSLFSIPGFGTAPSPLDGVTQLSLTFELPVGTAIDSVTPPNIGSGNATVLYTSNDGTWNRQISGTSTVTFLKPPNTLSAGETFFANVYFNQPMPSVSFRAAWTIVPDPTTGCFTVLAAALGITARRASWRARARRRSSNAGCIPPLNDNKI